MASRDRDRREMVFESARHGNTTLYIINTDGTGERRLTYTGYGDDTHPAWSPDGRTILFARHPSWSPDGRRRGDRVLREPGRPRPWEVWMAASAMGPMGALQVATIDGARFIGIDKDVGSLVTGKLADLVVLDGNPLDDIRQTKNIRYVMKGGVLYDGIDAG